MAGLLIWVFLAFGLSDWRHPENMDQYIGRNPLRPVFRAAFGWIMASLVLGSAVWVTRSFIHRKNN
jgi:hypothetical protein